MLEIFKTEYPFFFAVFLTIIFLYGARYLVNRRVKSKEKIPILKIVAFFLVIAGLVAILLTLPIEDKSFEIRGSLLALLGVVLSASLALSSTSFLGNAFAGIMIRSIGNFKPGDFISVNDVFGAVTERGLFHVEIQTENSSLITFPNLYIVSNPVEVRSFKNRIIASEISIGYEVSRMRITECLLEAAKRTGLLDSFVYVGQLGDYSVNYKLYGFLQKEEKMELFTSKSKLNGFILDVFHEAGIEIVSPIFMNQRQVGETLFIPKKVKKQKEIEMVAPEKLILDKAIQAESIERKGERMEELENVRKTIQEELSQCKDDKRKSDLESRLNKLDQFKEQLKANIQEEKDKLEEGK